VMVASLLSCAYAFYQVRKLLGLSISQVYSSLKPALASSALMALVIIIFKSALGTDQVYWLGHFQFILLFAVAVSIYGYSLFRFEKTIFHEMREMMF
jgi:hypothetical protein